MDLRGRRESDNVEDARGRSGEGFSGRGGGGLGLLLTIGRVFGLKGIIVALVVGAVLWKVGLLDPSGMTGGGSTGVRQMVSPEEDSRFHLVKVVMKETEDVWKREFAKRGLNYQVPKAVVYRGQVQTACGPGTAAAGPFYCPGDRMIYLDLGFYDELEKTFRSPGDFAQAYVIAHEVGHHVQKLLGTSDKVSAMRGRRDYNEYSVRLELQADYYAGVWAHHSKETLKLDAEDIREAMRAANAIGDDAIQKQMKGRVVPHSFTHGTSAQRTRWFDKGFQNGTIEGGDTFSMPYSDL